MSQEATEPGSGWASGRVLSVGTRLAERYRIERFVAAGGMGEVYEVTDEALGERVALKVLTSASATLEEEVRLARRVTHVNVCRVFDLGVHELEGVGLRFLTMELLRGETLAAVLRRRGKLPVAEVRKLAAGVGAALEAAHAAGVVHGDLKPGNVLLTDTGRVVVTDFGLARSLETSAPASHGTPAYVSPEQVEGLPLTPASDMYALGVLVFELLTGEVPFRGASARETSTLRLSSPPDLAKLPEDFRREVAACLDLDPRQRPARPSFEKPRARRGRALGLVGLAAVLLVGGQTLRRGVSAFVPTPIALRVTVVPEDDWFLRASERLLGQVLERTCWLKVDPSGKPLTITLTKEEGRVRVESRLAGKTQTVVAASAHQAFAALAPALLATLGHTGDAPASQHELAAMKRFGARDVLAWRAFNDGDAIWRGIEVDTEAIARDLEAGLERDPGWARLWAKLVLVAGERGPSAKAVVARAREAVTPGRDPVGDVLLEVAALEQAGDAAGALKVLLPAFAEHGDDVLVVDHAVGLLLRIGRRVESLALLTKLHGLRPDLKFGGNIVGELLDFERQAEIPAVLERWLAAAPENEQAITSAAYLDAFNEDPHAAVWVDRAMLLHGRSFGSLSLAVRVYLTLNRFPQARGAGSALAQLGPRASSHAQYLLAVMSIFEGHLGSARESLLPALEQGRPFGLESLTTQTLMTLARLDRVAGRTEQEAAHLLDLGRTLEGFGDTQLALSLNAEARLAHGPIDCAETTRALGLMTNPATDLPARRYLTRVAARYGCADCAAVLKEGLGIKEPSTEGLLVYGKCAAELGQLPTARRALERAARVMTTGGFRLELDSPIDTALARYELARVAAGEGLNDEALRRYRAFVEQWGDTEVTLPELGLARAAIKRLEGR